MRWKRDGCASVALPLPLPLPGASVLGPAFCDEPLLDLPKLCDGPLDLPPSALRALRVGRLGIAAFLLKPRAIPGRSVHLSTVTCISALLSPKRVAFDLREAALFYSFPYPECPPVGTGSCNYVYKPKLGREGKMSVSSRFAKSHLDIIT
jgi:hypothetical protein